MPGLVPKTRKVCGKTSSALSGAVSRHRPEVERDILVALALRPAASLAVGESQKRDRDVTLRLSFADASARGGYAAVLP